VGHPQIEDHHWHLQLHPIGKIVPRVTLLVAGLRVKVADLGCYCPDFVVETG